MKRNPDWERALGALCPGAAICAFDQIDSTNAFAKEWARAGAPQGALVVAGEQTAGRGRLGRSFASPEGAGVYMTAVVWPGEEMLSLLTVAAAVAVCQAVEELSPARPGIKWVNDLIWEGRKICGILAEAVTAPGGARGAVVGIGVNLRAEALPQELRAIAGALEGVSRDGLIAAIWRHLMEALACPGEALVAEYRARSLLLGQRVRYQQQGVWREALAEDIGPAGELLVRDDAGQRQVLRAGEVTMHRETDG